MYNDSSFKSGYDNLGVVNEIQSNVDQKEDRYLLLLACSEAS